MMSFNINRNPFFFPSYRFRFLRRREEGGGRWVAVLRAKLEKRKKPSALLCLNKVRGENREIFLNGNNPRQFFLPCCGVFSDAGVSKRREGKNEKQNWRGEGREV